jgi:hypothetical protein
MPASASRHRATCQNHKGSQIRFFSQLAHFFGCSSSHKKASPETSPRGAHDAGLAARLAGGGDVPSVPDASFRFGGGRAGWRCGRFRANPTTHDRTSSKNAAPYLHPPSDLRRGAHPNRICAEVPINNPHPPPDLRRGAHTPTGCMPSGRITALPKPPAGPSDEGLA